MSGRRRSSRASEGGYPEWPLLDERLNGWTASIAWGTVYALIYIAFATAWWQFLLLPIHWVLGPTHGAIVNYLGHKVGYRNIDSDDNSRNTLVFDVLTMGELFQNNHHKYGQSPNFAVRWFEIDPAWQIIRVLGWVGVLDLSKSQKARWQRQPDARARQGPAPRSPAVADGRGVIAGQAAGHRTPETRGNVKADPPRSTASGANGAPVGVAAGAGGGAGCQTTSTRPLPRVSSRMAPATSSVSPTAVTALLA